MDKTRAEKIELLAKLMGWHKVEPVGRGRLYSQADELSWWVNEAGERQYPVVSWNPFKSWNYAGGILDIATNWILDMDGDGRVHCSITFDNPPYENWGFSNQATALEAICEAALKTMKGAKDV